MKIQIAAWIAAMIIVFGSTVLAQKEAPAPGKLEFHKWDVSSSLGVLRVSRREFGGEGNGYVDTVDSAVPAWNVDFGRYFTQHLKAEGSMMKTIRRDFYSYTSSQSSPYPGGPLSYAYSSTTRSVAPTSFSGAVTYQFFENVFAHPYVSAGIRVTSLSEESQTYSYDSSSFSGRRTSTSARRYTETRPFVAAGYKSYFSERVYMKSEALVAFDKKGASHGTIRLGFGIDF